MRGCVIMASKNYFDEFLDRIRTRVRVGRGIVLIVLVVFQVNPVLLHLVLVLFVFNLEPE